MKYKGLTPANSVCRNHLQKANMHAICVPGKRIIEGGFGGDAMKTSLNPSQASR
jgi:hypothetical protein